MVEHKCSNCDRVFSKKCDYDKHLSRKTPCSLKKNKRTVTEAVKKRIVNRQRHRCANKPGSNLRGLEGYDCLLWKVPDETERGIFDETGYQIDHKVEFCVSYNDSPDNLQALCSGCHRVKTGRFLESLKRTKKLKKCISKKSESDDYDDDRSDYEYSDGGSDDDNDQNDQYNHSSRDKQFKRPIPLRNGLTLAEVEIKSKRKMNIWEMIQDLLKSFGISADEHDALMSMIRKIWLEDLPIIVQLLTKAYCFKERINCDILLKKFNENKKFLSMIDEECKQKEKIKKLIKDLLNEFNENKFLLLTDEESMCLCIREMKIKNLSRDLLNEFNELKKKEERHALLNMINGKSLEDLLIIDKILLLTAYTSMGKDDCDILEKKLDENKKFFSMMDVECKRIKRNKKLIYCQLNVFKNISNADREKILALINKKNSDELFIIDQLLMKAYAFNENITCEMLEKEVEEENERHYQKLIDNL